MIYSYQYEWFGTIGNRHMYSVYGMKNGDWRLLYIIWCRLKYD